MHLTSSARWLTKAITLIGLAKSVASQGCPLPSAYNWTSTESLAQPASGFIAIKDLSHTPFNGQHLIYSTAVKSDGSLTMFGIGPFADWPDLASTPQNLLNINGFAPSIFFFKPKNIWVLIAQGGAAAGAFSYSTSSDPSNPNGWSPQQTLFSGSIDNGGPLDQTVISDGTNMYLFFAGDNGSIYRASMPVGNFPGDFGTESTTILTEDRSALFEAVQVYTLTGLNQYLMIVEGMGAGGRYFRSFTAMTLDGEWTPQTTSEQQPFAGKANTGVTWTNDISHGDVIRSAEDETLPVDPCNLQMLYQGVDPASTNVDYGMLPYQPGLLTIAD